VATRKGGDVRLARTLPLPERPGAIEDVPRAHKKTQGLPGSGDVNLLARLQAEE